ncbi:hypothetical protein JKF63_06624 [Porcisia hertigi]|uniref:PAP/OAS1 substrate-binding-related domain-containing protein n=1 Tax=Porcisia hertigi TaxID=2761500 RepID=A0A836IM26_9TRYP|nr:hypothetical protein JKF63_06624 [Porcisia hertigi]
MCDKETDGALSSSGGSAPAVTSAAVAGCDAAIPALRQSVDAGISSESAPVFLSRSLGSGSGSLEVTHSPESQSSGGGCKKGRLWRPRSFLNAPAATAAVSPDTTRDLCDPLFRHGDSAVSLRSDGEFTATLPHTCESLLLSPPTQGERPHRHEDDALSTGNLDNTGGIYSSTPTRCFISKRPPPVDSYVPPSRCQRSALMPSTRSDCGHTPGTRRTASCDIRSAGSGGGSKSSLAPITGGSSQNSSSSSGTEPQSDVQPSMQSASQPMNAAHARSGDEPHGGGSAHSSTCQRHSVVDSDTSHAPDASDENLPTVGSSARTSLGAAQPPSVTLLPLHAPPSENGTARNDSMLSGDIDNSNAVTSSTKKRKKKKTNKKKADVSALEVGSGLPPARCVGAVTGTGALNTATSTVNNNVPVTESSPPPPISLMPKGGGSPGSAVSGIIMGVGTSQGNDSGVRGAALYCGFQEQPQEQQLFRQQQLIRAGGPYATMDDCMRGVTLGGDSAGALGTMGYPRSGRGAGTEGENVDYTGAGMPTCGQGGSSLMMPISTMAPDYQQQQYNCRNGGDLCGIYDYCPRGMGDCRRAAGAVLSSSHTPIDHQGVAGSIQEGQNQQRHSQQPQLQPQPPYPNLPQPPPIGGGGSAGATSYQENAVYSRHGPAPSSGGVDCVLQYSSPPQHQQQQPYYYQNVGHNHQTHFYGGIPSATNGGDARAVQGRLTMVTGEGGGGLESGGRGDYASGSYTHGQGNRAPKPYKGGDLHGRVQAHVPMEGTEPPPPQLHRNVGFQSRISAPSSSGMLYYPPDCTAPASTTVTAAAVPNSSSAHNSYLSSGSRGGVLRAMTTRDNGTALDGVAKSPREEGAAADAALPPLFQFTSEVSPRLCRLIEREVLAYLTPSLACLQRRRSQLQTLAGYITAALRYAGSQTGHEYGDISYYIFGSVNMRTVLPDGDNDVTVEVEGLLARESTLTPPPSPSLSPPQPSSSTSPSGGGCDGCDGSLDAPVKPVMFPVTTDSSTGSVDGTMQLTTTADGCPRLAAPAVLSIASGEVLGRVRDYLRIAKTPVFVDSLVMAEVRVLKLAMEGCNYDITIGQFGGVNCVRFLHEMDAAIGGQHLLKRTLLLLKAWCSYEAHILGGQAGYIGSYAATVMLISMLNTVEFLEDIGEEHTSGADDHKAATAATTLGSLTSGHSVAHDEEQLVLRNPVSSSKGPEAGSAEATPTKGVQADHEKEGVRVTTCRGGGRPDCDSSGRQEPSQFCTAPHSAAASPAASSRSLSPLTLFARFLKFYAYFDFDHYCVTAFGPLPLHKISSTPLDLSYLEVDAAHSKTLDGVAASNRAATDLAFLGLTPEGEAAIGHLVRRRQQPLLTVSGVKHLLDEMNRSRLAERQARHEGRQAQSKNGTDPQRNASDHRGTGNSVPVQLNRAGCAAEDAGLMCPSCNTAVFPVRDMNVLDPLRWSSNMLRGVCRNHLQRIKRAFLEGLRLLDMASEVLSEDVAPTDVLSVGTSGSAARTTTGTTGGGTTERRGAGAAFAKVAASPMSQLSAISGASSSSPSWSDSAANGGTGQARGQQRVVGDVSTYGTPTGATENRGGGDGAQRCPGYPAPHSQCTQREVTVLRMLFPRTIDVFRKHGYFNCAWNQEGTSAAALTGVPQCPTCTKPSLLCAPAIHRMCQPQLIFRAPSTGGSSSTTVTGATQSKQPQSTSEKAALSPTSAGSQWQPPSAVSPTQSKAHQGLGGRRGNMATVEQVVSRLEEVFASQDASEAARYDGPLGEAVLPATEQPLGLHSAGGGVTSSQPPPPPPSPPPGSLFQGSTYGPGAVEGIMPRRPHQMYGPGGGGGYVVTYPGMTLSPATPEEEYYAMHGGATSGGGVSGAGSSCGYGPSAGHHGNPHMVPLPQQQQQHYPQQAYVRVGPMSSLGMQGGYNTTNGDVAGNSCQQAYPTSYMTSMPMESGGHLAYRSHNYARAVRHQQHQQP